MIYKNSHLEGSTKKVYQYLFDQIINNHLESGSAISEIEIANIMNTSRSPVREALTVLESEGLVKRYPRRGCTVAEVNIVDVEEIFELRILLELKALQKSCSVISKAELDHLENTLQSLTPDSDPQAYYESDRELHSMIIINCGNGRMVEFIGILNAQIERVRSISAMKQDRLPLSRAEHLEIVNAIRARDLPKASDMLKRHIENVRDSTILVCKQLNVARIAAKL